MAVYKDGDKWRVIYRYTNWQGERKQTQKRGFKTKREAQQWEREVMLKSESKLDMTFASFFEIYEADNISDVVVFCITVMPEVLMYHVLNIEL